MTAQEGRGLLEVFERIAERTVPVVIVDKEPQDLTAVITLILAIPPQGERHVTRPTA